MTERKRDPHLESRRLASMGDIPSAIGGVLLEVSDRPNTIDFNADPPFSTTFESLFIDNDEGIEISNLGLPKRFSGKTVLVRILSLEKGDEGRLLGSGKIEDKKVVVIKTSKNLREHRSFIEFKIFVPQEEMSIVDKAKSFKADAVETLKTSNDIRELVRGITGDLTRNIFQKKRDE